MPRTAASSAIPSIVALELRLHARDFMAWLGVMVFFFLAFAHASGGPIVLVSGALAAMPRTATPVLAQAMAGLTAFGQVITAMTAATVALRDVSLRSEGMVLSTGISWRRYLLGRYAATLVVLLLIYLAIPLGFAAGAWFGGGEQMSWPALALPLGTLVLPNVVLVAAAFFTAGALSGGFSVILLVGLGFIGLWQTGLSLASRGASLGALVDPFGNAALTLGYGLVWNRALWLTAAAAMLVITLWRWRPGRALARAAGDVSPFVAATSSQLPNAPLRGASSGGVWSSEYRFGLRWVLRDGGFVVLLGLALLNAFANGWSVATDSTALVRALEFHARLFGILIATIYAGELVWRDRDVRADAILDALPASRELRLLARASGVMTALLLLPLGVSLASLVLPLLRGGTMNATCTIPWLAGVGTVAFTLLFAASLAVHRIVQHKTAAHLLLISAWVAAIALGADALAQPWSRWGNCGP